MAQVNDIIFCMKARCEEGKGLSADTILTILCPEYIPGLFSFSIAFTLLDIGDESEHKIKALFYTPDGEEVFCAEGTISYNNDNYSNVPDEYKGINIAMEWSNVNLKISGLYTIKIYMDDVFLNEKSIFVKGKNE